MSATAWLAVASAVVVPLVVLAVLWRRSPRGAEDLPAVRDHHPVATDIVVEVVRWDTPNPEMAYRWTVWLDSEIHPPSDDPLSPRPGVDVPVMLGNAPTEEEAYHLAETWVLTHPVTIALIREGVIQ